MDTVDVVVVGSGPNGLSAAVTMARAGLSVRLYEQAATLGGGSRTAELTLPGYHHDVCSAVHPMALASPFFQRFQLERRIELVVPEISFAHPLEPGIAGIAYRDLERTADGLGRDGPAWRALMKPLVDRAAHFSEISSAQLLRIPPHPFSAARIGLAILEQGSAAWNFRFREERAPAMLTGVSAHSIQPLPTFAAAATGLALGAYAHAHGWPIPIGGSQAIIDAMVADLLAHGGEVVTDHRVERLEELPPSRAVLLDVSARGLRRLAGDRLPSGYARGLDRFRYGSGVAKVDFALSEPVPWINEELRSAGTVHLGGTRAQMAHSEGQIARGRHADDAYILLSQPSTFDSSRAPQGAQTLWTYTHVPAGSDQDQSEHIIATIERHAPGFRNVIEAVSSRTAVDVENYNPNYIGGDISAGAASTWQLLKRPVFSADPWRTPLAGVYLCSSSTAPGPGVHGLGGWNAARRALRQVFGIRAEPSLAVG